MEDLAADFIIENNEPLEFDAEISEPEHFDCSFELNAAGTTWGSISGTLSNQTDLQAALDLKADKSEVESVTGALADSITALDSVVSANYNTLSDSISAETTARQNADSIIGDSITALDNKFDSITGGLSDSITAIDNTIDNFGDIVTYNAADFADSAQGALADTAVQPTDLASVAFSGEYSDLINTPTIPTVNDGQLKIQVNGSDLATFSANQGTDTIANISIPNAAEWGNITGTLSDQTDLQNALDAKVTNNATGTKALAVGNTSQSTAEGGVAVGYGARANSTYATAVGEEARANNTNTTVIGKAAKATEARAIAIGSGAEANAQDAIAIKGINNTANTFQVYTYNMLDMSTGLIPDARISSNIARTSDMQTADNGLQSQIDAIVASSDVFDIVGTYAELQAYDISTVPVNDIIKVLVDSTHNDAATYYRCTETGGVKSWTYIGAEGAYYTKSESDNRFVPLTRTVNGIALSSDITLTASDVNALPDTTVIPTVNNSTITIQKNGANVDTFTLNQATAKTINITVPTDTGDLTNNAGYIKGITYADVITALGFTPYNSTNPNGYIDSTALTPYALISSLATVATTGSYNDLSDKPYIPSGVVVDQIYDATSQNAQAGVAIAGVLANYLQKDVAQSTTGTITFVGQKKIEFKQSAAADKLGFTCFNTSNTEIGAFEYRPNTIGSGALFNINVPYSSTSYVGFRYWGTAVNVVAPKVATAGTYYIPTHITDGNTTVTASNTGSVNISSLLPDISTKQDTLVSGTNIKTINNTSLLGSGNISVLQNSATGTDGLSIGNTSSNSFGAVSVGYSTEVSGDFGIAIGHSAKVRSNNSIQLGLGTNTTDNSFSVGFYSQNNYTLLDGTTGLIPDARISSNIARTSSIPTALSDLTVSAGSNITISGDTISATDTTYSDFTGADSVTAGTSGLVPAPSAGDEDKILTGGGSWESVNTVIGYTPVNKSGDTMTGDLSVVKDAPEIIMQNNNANADYTSTTSPSADIKFLDFSARDKNNNYTGGLTVRQNTANNFLTLLYARRKISGTEYSAYFNLYVDSSGNSHCNFPQTTCCDGQWVSYSQSIISSSTSLYNSGGSALGYRIALPNDGHNYEVLVTGRCLTSNTSGHFVVMTCNGNGDGATFTSYICGCRTRASNNVDAWGSTIVVCKYVASGSNNFWLARTSNSNGDGNCEELKVVAYRRIGTNS